MKRGLVIGKFMPLHKGHIALIQFAAAQCDELIVSMSYKPDDPIPGPLRFSWIKQEFANVPSIRTEISLDDFDRESISWAGRIPLWSAFLKRRFPPVDVIFSSEEYGPRLAENLGIQHISFDLERRKIPISATRVREHPLRFWDFIAAAARPYFVKKICFYGPESTGKSTLAEKLARDFDTEFVPEVSREFITSNDFTIEDILKIGQAQTQRVLQKLQTANKFLFCDTDLITTQIYCRHYLHQVPTALSEWEKQITYDKYLLFDIDVAWVADGLRDLGHRRQEMFDVFKHELDIRKLPFTLISGNYQQREQRVRETLQLFL
ncbi:MAG: AAA family ATPase [Cyclobacteriaceae bacterium]|nr:AAA family ATPase [Cyclobacteriaceae bacterium]